MWGPSRGSSANSRIFSRLQNQKPAPGNKDLHELNNLSLIRHRPILFLDQWVTFYDAALDSAPVRTRWCCNLCSVENKIHKLLALIKKITGGFPLAKVEEITYFRRNQKPHQCLKNCTSSLKRSNNIKEENGDLNIKTRTFVDTKCVRVLIFVVADV